MPCSRNTIADNTVVNAGKSGIAIAGTQYATHNNHVTGNTVVNCNRIDTESHQSGVLLYGEFAVNNLVADNYVFDNIGALNYGVHDWGSGGDPVGTSIKGNRIVGAPAGQEIKRASTSTEALNDRAFIAWTPTVTAGTGAVITGAVYKYYELEKLVYLSVEMPVTTAGTGVPDIKITLPFTASAHPAVVAGRSELVGGQMLQGAIAGGGTQMRIFKYDNSYPAASGSKLVLSGFYER